MERKEAQALGFKTYMTGAPCKNGHLAYRYTLSGTCSECVNGTRSNDNPKTFSDKAMHIRTTALSLYNESLQSITKRYEEALAIADKLDNDAVQAAARYEEHQRKISETFLQKQNALKLKEETRQRKLAAREMIKIKVFIHPDDKYEVKEGMLDMARKINPYVTMAEINYRNLVEGGVLHEVRCFPQHKDELLRLTSQIYSNRTVVTTPQ